MVPRLAAPGPAASASLGIVSHFHVVHGGGGTLRRNASGSRFTRRRLRLIALDELAHLSPSSFISFAAAQSRQSLSASPDVPMIDEPISAASAS